MSEHHYGLIRYACYAVNVSMSVISTLSPLLFIGFRELYGISFSLLGTLVLVNFCTQLAIDIFLSFYAGKCNLPLLIRIIPVLTAAGLLLYALSPFLFPNAVYIGLLCGTVIFAASGGLSEVLISPVIAALPSDHPEKDMSRLHSVYAWGVVLVVTLSTLFLSAFGTRNWYWLALIWTVVPLLSCLLFAFSRVPPLDAPERPANVLSFFRNRDFLLCIFCIFLGGASECTMSQWASGYIEQALRLPKVAGDILGVALFALMLGLGRSLYAARGGNIYKVLTFGAGGAVLCYLMAALSASPWLALAACAVTGLCTAMLWPGSLIMAEDRMPAANVAIFALMAAGGDLGGSVGPQLVGIVTDAAMYAAPVAGLADRLGLSVQQLALKIGLLSAVLFPILATGLFALAWARRAGGKKEAVPAQESDTAA